MDIHQESQCSRRWHADAQPSAEAGWGCTSPTGAGLREGCSQVGTGGASRRTKGEPDRPARVDTQRAHTQAQYIQTPWTHHRGPAHSDSDPRAVHLNPPLDGALRTVPDLPVPEPRQMPGGTATDVNRRCCGCRGRRQATDLRDAVREERGAPTHGRTERKRLAIGTSLRFRGCHRRRGLLVWREGAIGQTAAQHCRPPATQGRWSRRPTPAGHPPTAPTAAGPRSEQSGPLLHAHHLPACSHRLLPDGCARAKRCGSRTSPRGKSAAVACRSRR